MRESRGIATLLRKILRADLYGNLRVCVLADVINLRFSLLALDGLLIPYSIYLDLKYYLRSLPELRRSRNPSPV